MKASKVATVLNEIAPPKLAYKDEELGFVVGNREKEVKVIGITERPTIDVLKAAVREEVDLLVIHEPLYHLEKSVIVEKSLLSFPPNKSRKELVEKGGFAVFRYHSQWDEAVGGNNDVLAALLGVRVTEKIPFGRIGNIEKTSLQKLAEVVKEKLGNEKLLVVGNLKQEVTKIAVIAGSGNSLTEMMEYVRSKGAEVLVSGDITDGRARFAKEIGLSVIDAGDYYTENPGAKKLAEILTKKFSGLKVSHLDPGKPWTAL